MFLEKLVIVCLLEIKGFIERKIVKLIIKLDLEVIEVDFVEFML